ncbi:hypothetical protein C6501_08080 [Candidatus Poribacteria bacterium]|nr:MAG: hypothetical protein C6501_08080 [Candidatus Poribacteria bacterium]
MEDLLKQNNIALRNEIEKLQCDLIDTQSSIPDELKPYAMWVTNVCENIHQRVLENIRYLEYRQENLLKDILSRTQSIANDFAILNQHQASPILRARTSDRLPLKLLLWLHTTHSQTENIPVAVGDGVFSIWPIEPSIYFTPCAAQQGLLNLPIFFHEFGHLLYRYHQQEMNDLVRELQAAIGGLLPLAVDRDDKYTEIQEQNREVIVQKWYTWTQEFYCDAVGFMMSGPSFAYAFSMYLRILGRTAYYLSVEELGRSSHPVAWIRIHLLADRARQTGYVGVAIDLEEKWNEVATALGIIEDYGGFYNQSFLPVIQQKLDDMLTETSPREFLESEVSNHQSQSTFTSPVALLNMAWHKFLDDPDTYGEWEEGAIESFLETDF